MLWNDRFSLGIEAIDEQHKKLIDMIEETQGLIRDAEDGIDCYDEIVDILNALADYTVYHFEYEEQEMQKAGFEGLDIHVEQHEAFVDKVNEFIATDIDEDHLIMIEEVVSFLLGWVSEHILVTDALYMGVL